MERTKSDFKALREMVGMPQSILAELAKVNVQSVKRWERPDNDWQPPQDAWDVLDEARERQLWMVDAAIEKAQELMDEFGEPGAIDLTYWHSAKDFDSAHPGEGKYFQMANANSRLVAHELEMMDVKASFNFGGLAKK